MSTQKAAAFDYTQWPTVSYGNAHKPHMDGAQWTAWISAGGQHDAVICHGPNKESVLALRKHLLSNEKVAFLLNAIDKIATENSVRGDSDRTGELIAKIKRDFTKKFFA